jgi:predicted DNA-binding transcriptional regulator AlpA
MQSADLLDLRAVCALLGGSRPINGAPLYRGIRKGRYPAPIKIGPNASQWLRGEIEASLAAMIARRVG